MMTRTVIMFILIALMINSCAGLGIKIEARSEFDAGIAQFNKGNYKDAVYHFERATDIDPDYGKAYLYLGRSYISMNKWTKAIPPLRAAYRLSPEETRKEAFNVLLDALFGAAVEDFRKGEFSSSTQLLREALELDPQSVKTKAELAISLIALGGKLLSEGRTDEAIGTFTEALGLSPDNPEAYIGLAKSFFRNGDFIEALKAATNAISLDPASGEAKKLLQEIEDR